MPPTASPPVRPVSSQHAQPFHSGAWLVWTMAALAPAALTRNPVYLLLALGAVMAVYYRLARHRPAARAWGSFARLGLLLGLFSLAFNVLLRSSGTTRLLDLPGWQWRDEHGQLLFQIGGPVTLEDLVQGLMTALALLIVLLALATFNALADHYQLLRGLPPFLYQSATVVSIALAFMPQLVTAQREIREAQALRGYRRRRLRDLPPLFVALLMEGLERSITLAESMEARGFGSRPGEGAATRARDGRLERLLIALGLALLQAGLLARALVPAPVAGTALAAAGVLLLAFTLWRLNRRVHRSRLRREPWRRRDTWLTLGALLSLAALCGLHWTVRSRLYYLPYPTVTWPPFDLAVAAIFLLPAAVALTPGGGPEEIYS